MTCAHSISTFYKGRGDYCMISVLQVTLAFSLAYGSAAVERLSLERTGVGSTGA